MPKVSFILPAYKARFLREAIASILAQTYRDFELIVVDDCSPQGLKAIVDEFDDPRLTYHCNETNIGGKDLVAAWNKALSYAKGEWVVCASDDDVYLPDFVSELMTLSGKYPEVDVLHCRIAYIDESGRVTREGGVRAEYETGMEMFYHGCIRHEDQRISDFMIRRSRLVGVGGYAQCPRAWCSDFMTVCEAAYENGAVCSSRILFEWRSSAENISSVSSDAEEKMSTKKCCADWVRGMIERFSRRNDSNAELLGLIRAGAPRFIWGNLSFYARLGYFRAKRIIFGSKMDEEFKKKYWRACRSEILWGWIKMIGR